MKKTYITVFLLGLKTMFKPRRVSAIDIHVSLVNVRISRLNAQRVFKYVVITFYATWRSYGVYTWVNINVHLKKLPVIL